MRPPISGICQASKSQSTAIHKTPFFTLPIRALSTSNVLTEELKTTTPSSQEGPLGGRPPLDANTARNHREERKLLRSGVTPIGSRRRRAVLATSVSSKRLAFEQLPYQCFQEARKVLQADRQEKVKQIDTQRARIERLQAQDVSEQGEHAQKMKETRLVSMRKHLEELKVFADINDPLVKKRFEDGEGGLTRGLISTTPS